MDAARIGNVYDTLGTENKFAKEKNTTSTDELGQQQFLELMIAQLENQDPLNPQENGEFIAQLAQFSTVEGIDRLNSNFADFSQSMLSEQALQAANLVGRQVMVEGNLTTPGAPLALGKLDFETPVNGGRLNVYNENGQLLQQISFDGVRQGQVEFAWDGARVMVGNDIYYAAEGAAVTGEGPFELRFEGIGENGVAEAAEQWMAYQVTSVSLESSGPVANLDDGNKIPVNEIIEIR
jgi:flagellar basal-body rod modification protein FlgD